jgi:hypothetical protein
MAELVHITSTNLRILHFGLGYSWNFELHIREIRSLFYLDTNTIVRYYISILYPVTFATTCCCMPLGCSPVACFQDSSTRFF